jgi:hypothetical protein
MKTQIQGRNQSQAAVNVDRKNPQLRPGPKPSTNRYERRKIREQLRNLDWALVGVD